MEEWKLRGKDTDPISTVNHIKELLDNAGIKTVYSRGDVSIDGCYYSRLIMDMPYGDMFGTNGKGMSDELCMASAYGEFMERIQNMIFAAAVRNGDPAIRNLFPEDAPMYDLNGDYQPKCITELISKVASSINTLSFLSSPEDMAKSMLQDAAPDIYEGKYPMELYYSAKERKAVYLPTGLLQQFIFSNGMAAGNTLEEAIVEGMSEIFERYSQMQFYSGGITPPSIPDEEIDRWPRIRKLITEIEKTGRYTVDLRDCSLGKELPVVCAIFVDNETGGVGIKFGSQPDMGVAMERTFTEAMQGKTISQASSCNIATFRSELSGKRNDQWNTIKVGAGHIPAEILAKKPDYPFKPWKDVSGFGNAELVRDMTALAQKLGGDVYISDNSYLGFPSVCIYVAGLSEVKPVDSLTLKETLLQEKVKTMFDNPDDLDDASVQKMMMLARIKSGAVLENTIASISGYRSVCPLDGFALEGYLLQIVGMFRLGNYSAALTITDEALRIEKEYSGTAYNRKYLIALRLLLEGLVKGTPADMVRDVMDKNCGVEIAERVSDEFCDPAKVLGKMFKSEKVVREAEERYSTIVNTYEKLGALKKSNLISKETMEEHFHKIGL